MERLSDILQDIRDDIEGEGPEERTNPGENYVLEPQNTLAEVISELKTLLDDYHIRETDLHNGNYPFLPQTADQIKEKFLEYHNTIPDPHYVTGKFLVMVGDDYGVTLGLIGRDKVEKDLYDIISKYNQLSPYEEVDADSTSGSPPGTPPGVSPIYSRGPPSVMEQRREERNQLVNSMEQLVLEPYPELEE